MPSSNVSKITPGIPDRVLESPSEDCNTPSNRYSGGNGGGDDMQVRVAKLESDIEYIKRDIAEVKSDIKSIDSRLSTIETGITSAKTTIKASATIVSVVFAFCAYIFGSYVSKILDALNGLVLK